MSPHQPAPTRHAASVRLLHWLTAVVITVAWFLGHRIEDFEHTPAEAGAIGLHITVASGVLLLVLLRLAARISAGVPALPDGMSPAARLLSQGVHGALYLLMLALPMSGWLMANSGGHAFTLLGRVPMPTLIGKNEGLHKLLEQAHGAMGWLLALLVGLHVLAALKHHFIDKDDVLSRMLPPRAGR